MVRSDGKTIPLESSRGLYFLKAMVWADGRRGAAVEAKLLVDSGATCHVCPVNWLGSEETVIAPVSEIPGEPPVGAPREGDRLNKPVATPRDDEDPDAVHTQNMAKGIAPRKHDTECQWCDGPAVTSCSSCRCQLCTRCVTWYMGAAYVLVDATKNAARGPTPT